MEGGRILSPKQPWGDVGLQKSQPHHPLTVTCLPRPSFVKLEQWLETLHMHLAGHLPLGPQLEQLERGFWETYRRGESSLPAHPEVPD